MSWSKYYKDSSTFKREEIVKPSAADHEGWKSDTAPSEPFKPGSKSLPQTRGEKPSRSSPATKTDHEAATPSTSDTTPPPVEEQVHTEPVDLSNYVTVEEAEAKAVAMYQQGIQEGIDKATEDFGSASKTLTTICEQLDTVRETIISNSSAELTDFAILIAEKIIRLSLKEQNLSIVATIQEALLRAVRSDEFTVFINPDDYQTIEDKSADLIAGVSGLNNIVLKTDPTIEPGGAKIESENCIIDATVGSQFETIREEILRTNG